MQNRQKKPAQPKPVRPRAGPQPLLLHLTLAGQMWLNWPMLLQSLQNGSAGSNGGWSKIRSQAAALDPDDFAAALARAGIGRARDYLRGIALYRAQPDIGNRTEAAVIARAGGSRLLDYAPGAENRPAVLCVPSLVNRYHILDLSARHSLLRWLTAQGIRVFLADWGVLGDAEAGMGLTDYAARLAGLARSAQDSCGGRRLHLLGHCMGGNLALGLAFQTPEIVRSLILLATPWDFSQGGGQLGRYAAAIWERQKTADPAPEFVPAALVQTLFALAQPVEVTEKFRHLGRSPPDQAKLRLFTLVEDWLNDGVPLTLPVCREIVEDWYGANLPGRGLWRLGGRMVQPQKIAAPALVVIAGHDRIVPPASAAALAAQLPRAQALHLPLGHIGMIVGSGAKTRLWRPLAAWIKRQEIAGS